MAQLVARDVWDVDAAGSSPVIPTKIKAALLRRFDFNLKGLVGEAVVNRQSGGLSRAAERSDRSQTKSCHPDH